MDSVVLFSCCLFWNKAEFRCCTVLACDVDSVLYGKGTAAQREVVEVQSNSCAVQFIFHEHMRYSGQSSVEAAWHRCVAVPPLHCPSAFPFVFVFKLGDSCLPKAEHRWTEIMICNVLSNSVVHKNRTDYRSQNTIIIVFVKMSEVSDAGISLLGRTASQLCCAKAQPSPLGLAT